MEFREAIESLAQAAGIDLPAEEVDNALKSTIKNRFMNPWSAPQSCMKASCASTKIVVGLSNTSRTEVFREIARDFRLGFAPEGWDNLMQTLTDEDSVATR